MSALWAARDDEGGRVGVKEKKETLPTGTYTQSSFAVVLFSLIATCQRHQVEPMAYLRDVLTRIAATPLSQLPDLLPDRWQPSTTD